MLKKSVYKKLVDNFARGWNTWNTRSVLSHVLLPEGFAINLGLKEYSGGKYLKESLIGKFGENDEQIVPGPHSYNGSFTDLTLKWEGIEIKVQSAVVEDELILLVTTLSNQKYPPKLVVEAGILWNREGYVVREGNSISGILPGRKVIVYTTKDAEQDPYINAQTPYIAMSLEGKIGISTGMERSLDEIGKIIEDNIRKHSERKEEFGELSEVYNAMQSCMAWDTIYDPLKDRVITTVSRLWNANWGGYVLFCWDTYFGALMASIDSKELAYSNVIEITKEITESGFVPNFAAATGCKSRDRSQPPVGSMTVLELYHRFMDLWLLEEVFDDLMTWNRWFIENREIQEGLLAWGSSPYDDLYYNYWEVNCVDSTIGGALESGLDNSPMYDDIPFNKEKHIMELADVGLTSLYIMDCTALTEIACVLGKANQADELKKRAVRCNNALQTLWDNETGIFLNKRTDTNEFSKRISPTNFYPLLSRTATQKQAERMIQEHFYNPKEFWGEWMIPSISRNDPGYLDQDYWRGRIWAPMNFLVYIGLRNYDLPHARNDLTEKSINLILKEWLEHGHVHENYCGNTGEGCNSGSSDKFYHWGALLSLIGLMDKGFFNI